MTRFEVEIDTYLGIGRGKYLLNSLILQYLSELIITAQLRIPQN